MGRNGTLNVIPTNGVVMDDVEELPCRRQRTGVEEGWRLQGMFQPAKGSSRYAGRQ